MNPTIFLNTILRNFYAAMHRVEQDNYDARRHSFDGVDRSQVFDADRHADYMTLFAQQYQDFFATWLLLGDDVSRERFARLIVYRLLGHLHSRIRDDARASTDAPLLAAAERWRAGPSRLTLSSVMGALEHFEGVAFDGQSLRVDCGIGNIVYTFLKRQYYYERAGVRIQPEAGDRIIDAGACVGDTAVAFAARVGPAGRVFAFDPLPVHVTASRYNLEQNAFHARSAVVPLAVGSATSNANLKLTQETGVLPGFSIIGQEAKIPMTTIDDFVAAEKPGRIDFIKMDIEGAELAALQGAAATLVRDRPKLAISLYHRPEDFVTIPRFLATMLPDYSFHLEHYTIHHEETVLYGAPRSRG